MVPNRQKRHGRGLVPSGNFTRTFEDGTPVTLVLRTPGMQTHPLLRVSLPCPHTSPPAAHPRALCSELALRWSSCRVQAPSGSAGTTLAELHEGWVHDVSQIPGPVIFRSPPRLPISPLGEEVWATVEKEPGSVPRKDQQGHCTRASESTMAADGQGQEARDESSLLIGQLG